MENEFGGVGAGKDFSRNGQGECPGVGHEWRTRDVGEACGMGSRAECHAVAGRYALVYTEREGENAVVGAGRDAVRPEAYGKRLADKQVEGVDYGVAPGGAADGMRVMACRGEFLPVEGDGKVVCADGDGIGYGVGLYHANFNNDDTVTPCQGGGVVQLLTPGRGVLMAVMDGGRTLADGVAHAGGVREY